LASTLSSQFEVGFTNNRLANKPAAREWPSSAFFEVVVPVELVYNQSGLPAPAIA